MELMEEIVEKSYQELVKQPQRVPHIEGLNYREYTALLMFVDAFADIVLSEYPQIADKVVKPGKDLMSTVPGFFEEKELDVTDYIDLELADELISNANLFWKDKITVADLVKFDKEAFGHLILVALGHKDDLEDIPRVKKFLDSMGVEAPTTKDLGVDLDHERYKAAYKALKDMKVIKESKDIMRYLERAKADIETAHRSVKDQKIKRRLQEILYELDAVSHE